MSPNWKMVSLISLVALATYGQKTDAASLNHSMSTESESRFKIPQNIEHEGEDQQNQSSVGTWEQHILSTSYGALTNISLVEGCPPLEVLDFLHFNPQNITEVRELEKIWPCEVRTYWLSIQGFVSTVRFLFSYVTIVLVIFGLLVNSASLCVLSSPPMNTSSISVYLRALAISDIGALLFNVTIGFLRGHIQKVNDFYVENNVMCFLQRVLSILFFYNSTWLVVALTVERLVMIKSPFKGHKSCNIRTSTFVIVILGFVCLIIGLVRTQLTGFENDNMYGYSACASSSSEKPKWNYYIIPFMAFNTAIPTILIFIANICLLVQIRRSAQDNSNLHASSSDEGMNTFRITRMLLVISVTYFVLLLPAGIVGSVEIYWKSSFQKNPSTTREGYIKWQQKMLLIKWIRGCCFFFFLLNYSINFFLYCISGRKFRETVKICLKRWLPPFCQCICLEQQNKISTTCSQKRTLVTSLSNLTLRQSEPPSDRRTSNSSVHSQHGKCNIAFVDSETTLNTNNKQLSDYQSELGSLTFSLPSPS